MVKVDFGEFCEIRLHVRVSFRLIGVRYSDLAKNKRINLKSVARINGILKEG